MVSTTALEQNSSRIIDSLPLESVTKIWDRTHFDVTETVRGRSHLHLLKREETGQQTAQTIEVSADTNPSLNGGVDIRKEGEVEKSRSLTIQPKRI